MKYIVKNNYGQVIYCGFNKADAVTIRYSCLWNVLIEQPIETKLGGLYL